MLYTLHAMPHINTHQQNEMKINLQNRNSGKYYSVHERQHLHFRVCFLYEFSKKKCFLGASNSKCFFFYEQNTKKIIQYVYLKNIYNNLCPICR